MNQINETKSWLFEKVNKIKLLKALTRKKKKKQTNDSEINMES